MTPAFLSTLGRHSTDVLIAARDRVMSILDDRARQTNFFDTPAAAPPPAAAFRAVVPGVLSPSSVNCFQSCSAKWYYRKVLHLPETRSADMALGSAVHRAVASNFRQKMETLRDLSFESVRALFRPALADELASATLQPDETHADLENCGEALLKTYLLQAAPGIQPAAVELPVEGVVGGVPVHGFVDVLDVNGDVLDLKTASKKPSCVSADHRLQITTYTMLAPGASGRGRRDVVTKTKTIWHYQQTFEVTAADRTYAERLYSITLDQMQTGLVAPNRNSNLCSRRYCSFADHCERDFGGTVE